MGNSMPCMGPKKSAEQGDGHLKVQDGKNRAKLRSGLSMTSVEAN